MTEAENTLPGIENEKEDIQSQNTETTAMEVHHHPQLHHNPKPWKEYLLEYLMIFLAVLTGFFAESLRENLGDSKKENEFVRSMIEDAKTDTANIHIAIAYNKERQAYLDSMANKCFNYGMAGAKDNDLYSLLWHCFKHPDFVSPTERTLVQLKSAGNMRLIKNTIAVDSIIEYDDFAKKLVDQQTWYENGLTALLVPSEQIFNLKFVAARTIHPPSLNPEPVTLITSDKQKIIEFGNGLFIYRGLVSFYITRLQEGEVHAVNLMKTLRKEYNLVDE